MCFRDPMAQLNELRVVDPCFSVSPTPNAFSMDPTYIHIHPFYSLRINAVFSFSAISKAIHYLRFGFLKTKKKKRVAKEDAS
jgi:hypothetical protein